MTNVVPWVLTIALSPLALAQQPAGPPVSINADVQQLLARETRQAAMVRILARGLYRGDGSYKESAKSFQVGHVVPCEQESGLPIFAVIGTQQWGQGPSRIHGHLIKVASDGVVVRCWLGNNMTDGILEDVNNDGLVERVETMNYGVAGGATVRELFVLPITEEVVPSLRVAIDVCEGPAFEWTSAWRVLRAKGKEPVRVQIGPADPKTGEPATVIAEWRWNADRSAWIGPGGGPGKAFVRLPPIGREGLEEFAQTRLGNAKK